MHVFDSEGELMEDLSQDPLIPGRMKSFIISKKKVFAVGYNRVKGKWDWEGLCLMERSGPFSEEHQIGWVDKESSYLRIKKELFEL